jgi:WD40 repeat protein
MTQPLRIFLSSPSDVGAAREITALTIERLAQDYARFFKLEVYLWENEVMLASGHFQDSIEPPSAFDIVMLILWSRLGTHLPQRTAVREYRGIDGRAPVTGTEWEYEEALQSAKKTGAPDLLVYRSTKPAPIDLRDPGRHEEQVRQHAALNQFWSRHFANQGVFLSAYTDFANDAELASLIETQLRKIIEKRVSLLKPKSGEENYKVWLHAPYRGLEAYDFQHAPIFFGQDDAMAKAMLQLTAKAEMDSPFLLVLGASGSGKSSLVKAGIIPKLFVPRRMRGAAFLRRVVFRPSDTRAGEDIFAAFARKLTTRVGEQEGLPELLMHGVSVADLATHLRGASSEPSMPFRLALGQLSASAQREGRLLEHENAKLVLMLDQLEELFTHESIASADRVRFSELIANLVRSGLVWTIATMRKDFWHRSDETPEFVRLSEGNGRLDLLPPSPAQLSQMIRRPAMAAGLNFEKHARSNVPLNDAIADDVTHSPGALPLLSYLLDQLYRRDVLDVHGAIMTFDSYEALGRLEGAIATKAEAVLNQCAPEDRRALGSVLFSLVQMDTVGGDVERAIARRVPLSTFASGTPQRRLVDALLDPEARLLVSDSENEGIPFVRIAHEALIRRWPKAHDFVQSNAEALKIRRRIEERYSLWKQLRGTDELPTNNNGKVIAVSSSLAARRSRFGREPGLLTDIDLTDGKRLLLEHRSETDSHLVDFIERSEVADRRIRTRSFRILAAVAGLIAILAVAASGAAWLADQKEHEAEYQRNQTDQAQLRLLTHTASERLKGRDVRMAQSIILEVLSHAEADPILEAQRVSVFQETRAADYQHAVLSGHGATVFTAAYSPDGKRVVTASQDSTARIWEATTGALLIVLSGHADAVRSAAYSPDGQRIVTASADKTAHIWDARTGSQLAVLSGHVGPVNFAAYSPDGQRIATTSDDGTLRIWDAATFAQLNVLSGHTGAVLAVAYSPDGGQIATASAHKSVRIWNAATGALITIAAGHDDVVHSIAYSPDGKNIVTASDDKTGRIWDVATGKQVAMLSGHAAALRSAAYSPDGKRIVTAADDSTARIWDAATGAQLAVLSVIGPDVRSAAYSPDGRRIVTASSDTTARIWYATPPDQVAVLSGDTALVNFAAYSQNGKQIVTASGDLTARIWDASTATQIALLSGHTGSVVSADYSPDAKSILTASYDNTARIWDVATLQQVRVFNHGNLVTDAVYSHDGRQIATGSYDNTVRIWDVNTGAQLSAISGHNGPVRSVAYSPDGKRFVTASDDKTARIWDANSGAPLAVLSGHDASVRSAAYSPDGLRVVTSSNDKTARIWDAVTGKQLITLVGHADELRSAAYSPDGKKIVTAAYDSTARIWDSATGEQLAVLPVSGPGVRSAAYSPDGKYIVTGGLDTRSIIWQEPVVANLAAQIAWSAAAEFDPMSKIERFQLGLPQDPNMRTWPNNASKCDQAAAAFYDRARRAPGVAQALLDVAVPACTQAISDAGATALNDYQLGRAFVAKKDYAGARRQFELAISKGSDAARIDLANILIQPSAGMLDPNKAISLYQDAWQQRVGIAAFELGQLYELGVLQAAETSQMALQPDLTKAWDWYRKGSDAGEPNALARFARRSDDAAASESTLPERSALFFDAFRYYAAAAESAKTEDWPDDVWKNWRYRRATLARLLARAGMMQQVADSYSQIRQRRLSHRPMLAE